MVEEYEKNMSHQTQNQQPEPTPSSKTTREATGKTPAPLQRLPKKKASLIASLVHTVDSNPRSILSVAYLSVVLEKE